MRGLGQRGLEPDPCTAADQAEFRDLLKELMRWAGYMSLRQLEAGAARRGIGLPVSTAHRAVTADRLPTADVVRRFVIACAGDVGRWTAARDALADRDRAHYSPTVDKEPSSGRNREVVDVWSNSGRAAFGSFFKREQVSADAVRRRRVIVWALALLAVLGSIVLIGYFARLDLDRADKLASVLSLFVALFFGIFGLRWRAEKRREIQTILSAPAPTLLTDTTTPNDQPAGVSAAHPHEFQTEPITTTEAKQRAYRRWAVRVALAVFMISVTAVVVIIFPRTAPFVANIPVDATGQRGVAVAPDGSVYVANDGSGNVSVIDPISRTVTYIGAEEGPEGVSVAPDGRVYVANTRSNTVSVIDPVSRAVTTISVGGRPYGIAVAPDGSNIYVTNEGSQTLWVIDAISRAVTSISVGDHPYEVAVDPDGSHVYVANGATGTVSVIEAVSRAVTHISVEGDPYGVAVASDGSQVYVTHRQSDYVSVINVSGE